MGHDHFVLQPLENLRREHSLIEAVLEVMDCEASRLVAGLGVRANIWAMLRDFMEEFGNGCHCRKEEEVLVPTLLQLGMPSDRGPVQIIQHDHVEQRALEQRLHQAIDSADTDEIVNASRSFAHLQRRHLRWEEDGVFRLVQSLLSPERAKDMAEELLAFDLRVLGAKSPGKHADIALQLAELAGAEEGFCRFWPKLD